MSPLYRTRRRRFPGAGVGRAADSLPDFAIPAEVTAKLRETLAAAHSSTLLAHMQATTAQANAFKLLNQPVPPGLRARSAILFHIFEQFDALYVIYQRLRQLTSPALSETPALQLPPPAAPLLATALPPAERLQAPDKPKADAPRYLDNREPKPYDGFDLVKYLDPQTVEATPRPDCPIANAVCHARLFAGRNHVAVRLWLTSARMGIYGKPLTVTPDADEVDAIAGWARGLGFADSKVHRFRDELFALDADGTNSILDMLRPAEERGLDL
jgi:hypothetical protein